TAARHAAHLHGLQLGHRSQCSGAAHLPIHVTEYGKLFLSREFMGGGPTRRAANEAQIVLPIEAVHLVDHSVDVVVESVSSVENIPVEREQGLDAMAVADFRTNAQIQVAQPTQDR